jgi:ElaA protein
MSTVDGPTGIGAAGPSGKNGGVRLYDHAFPELDPATLYAILRLRVDVFVVEQACPYPELDGRDLEPATRHLWLGPADDPADPRSYLRVLTEPDGTARIGRVCTTPAARGLGLSRRLVAAALQRSGERPCVLDAQSYLVDFYRSLGFASAGPEFVEDGIPHVPMRRDA